MSGVESLPAFADVEPLDVEPLVEPVVDAAPARTAASSKPGAKTKVNTALRFYHDVIGLEHLHYGLWNGEPRTLSGLKVAQERYVDYVASWIPADVRSILDVGCGTGAMTARLVDAGFDTEGLAPDPYQQTLFEGRTDVPFHLKRFHELEPQRRYDLVLMSESAQYIWLEHLLAGTARASPGGYLLISDYFLTSAAEGPLASSGHPLEEFEQRMSAAGFRELRREDVTDAVTPTLDLARSWLDRYIEPTGRLLAERYPRLARCGRWLFPSLSNRFEELKVLIDSDAFSAAKRYLILLYRVPDGPVPVG